MMNYDKKYWDTGKCPKVDCRKGGCKCGLEKVFLATILGDDSKDSPVAPKKGAYCNAIVVYEANNHMYIYSKDGIPTLITSGDGGDYDEIIEKIQKGLHDTKDDLSQEILDRIAGDNTLQDEIDAIKNSPDVVDIVDTYADLQSYDTSGLTDKDVIRVITDETKDGLSSYYRWNSPNPGWNFIGVIPGGDGVKELSSSDYNYPTANPDRVALWLLDNGLYTAPAGVMVAASTTSYPWYNTSDKTILVGGSDTVKGIYTFLNGKVDVITVQVSDGVEADEYTLFKSNQVLQTTGQSVTDTMSQKAVTDALAGSGITELTSADYNYPENNPIAIALWTLEPGFYRLMGNTRLQLNSTDTPIEETDPSTIILNNSGANTWSEAVIYSYNSILNSRVGRFVITGPNGQKSNNSFKEAPTVVQTAGNSTTDVMSQDATTKMVTPTATSVGILASEATGNSAVAIGNNSRAYQSGAIAIGGGTSVSQAARTSAVNSVAIGANSSADGSNSISIGYGSRSYQESTSLGDEAGKGGTSQARENVYLGHQAGNVSHSNTNSVALGHSAQFTRNGEVNIGAGSTANGYNSTPYRVLGGVHDGQDAHDAVTVSQINSVIDAINTALSTNISHIGT